MPPEQVPSGPLFDLSRPQDLVDLLSRVGFVDCHAETRVKPVALRSLDLLLDAAWKIAGLDSQPHSVQDQIRAGTIARAVPHRQADGSYLFRDEVLLSRARR